jgi:hypothetical protein
MAERLTTVVVIQSRFLSFEEERATLAELAAGYLREGVWRQEQSLLALARWLALPKRPRAPWLDNQIRVSVAAATLQQRAAAMRRHLRLTPALYWGW